MNIVISISVAVVAATLLFAFLGEFFKGWMYPEIDVWVVALSDGTTYISGTWQESDEFLHRYCDNNMRTTLVYTHTDAYGHIRYELRDKYDQCIGVVVNRRWQVL